ncbi:MAG TPA: exosortase/archaeosortase family protein [Chloroflexota bacterium]|nr:exosortase/archaeosortase family protein [Chloroflexota bacterium]
MKLMTGDPLRSLSSSFQRPSRSTMLVVGGVVLAVLLAYRDIWPWLISEWRYNPYYSHGALVPLLALFLVWRGRSALRPRGTSNWGYLLIAVGLAVLVIGLWMSAYWIAGLSLPIVIGGVVLALLGPQVFRQWAFPLLFLFLAIPLPFDVWVAQWLETPTATISTSLVQLVGVPAENKGSLIQLPNSLFQVGGECAGLRTSISLFTLALFVVMVGTPGGGRNKAALLSFIIPLALVANTVRVAVLILVAHAWGTDAAMNYYHDYASYVFFGLALALLIGISGVLRCPLWRVEFDLRPS